jgi:hypothetical protein
VSGTFIIAFIPQLAVALVGGAIACSLTKKFPANPQRIKAAQDKSNQPRSVAEFNAVRRTAIAHWSLVLHFLSSR